MAQESQPHPGDESAGEPEAFRATVSGGVQGVGFRAATVDRARSVGALGWVRNQHDGTVLVHAEGPRASLGALHAFLHEGPPGAAVDAVQVSEATVEGHEQFAIRGVSAGRFVVEEHPGDTPFFVLRLQVDGADRAWRLSKAPSMVPADKRFAVELDARPVDQPSAPTPSDAAADPAAAEPSVPQSSPPTAWDEGIYEQGGRVAWPEAIDRGHAVFVLHGDRLQGGFALQRTRGSGPRAGWLLIKRRDEFVRAA